ncbi:MAG: hypothetical protein IKY01_09695 [Prevotella sp.]|nr:hypothetical protein [Prevotella sp.]
MDKRFIQEMLMMSRRQCVVLILLTCLSLFVISSCSSIDCPVQNTVSVQYEIHDKTGAALSLIDSLSVITERQDGQYVSLNRLIGKSAFSLPISYSHPEDILYFCFKDSEKTLIDTVWIKKDDIPHFESVDCSAAFFHELTNVRYTHNAIDSLVLVNTSVTYDVNTVHFYLYPKTGN